MGFSFKKTAILGVGLLGASFALAIRENGICSNIAGFGRRKENLEEAKERGIIDSFSLDPAQAVKGADLVVLSTPVGCFKEISSQIKKNLAGGSIQIDLGSVKGNLVYELEKILPRYVACHPIAGGERPGIADARGNLFKGMKCIIAKTPSTDEEAFKKISSLWERLGSRVELMDPMEHDRIFALVSHLPHLAAYALVNTVGDVDPELMKLAGAGLKDTTRIAASSPELWRDVSILNGDNLVSYLEMFIKNLEKIASALREKDGNALERLLSRAQKLRKTLEN